MVRDELDGRTTPWCLIMRVGTSHRKAKCTGHAFSDKALCHDVRRPENTTTLPNLSLWSAMAADLVTTSNAVIWSFTSTAIVLVALRLISRLKLSCAAGLDDVFIFLALVGAQKERKRTGLNFSGNLRPRKLDVQLLREQRQVTSSSGLGPTPPFPPGVAF